MGNLEEAIYEASALTALLSGHLIAQYEADRDAENPNPVQDNFMAGIVMLRHGVSSRLFEAFREASAAQRSERQGRAAV